MGNTFNDNGYDNYFRLMQGILPDVLAMVLFDENREIIWPSDKLLDKQYATAIRKISSSSMREKTNDNDFALHQSFVEQSVFMLKMDVVGVEALTLAVLVNDAGRYDKSILRTIRRDMKELVNYMLEECMSDGELKSISAVQ